MLFRKLFIATLPMWLVFIVNSVLVYGLFIQDNVFISIVFHGAGGFAVAWTAHIIHRNILSSKITIHPVWLFLLFFTGLAAVFGIGWEIMEFIVNFFIISLGNNYGLADTLLDLVMDTVGGAVFFFGWFFFGKRE
ncbi:MAG: hypothetical protein WC862_05305 [Patescibacteria group bacterium]